MWVNHARATDTTANCSLQLSKLVKPRNPEICMFPTDGRYNLLPHVDNRWFIKEENTIRELGVSVMS